MEASRDEQNQSGFAILDISSYFAP